MHNTIKSTISAIVLGVGMLMPSQHTLANELTKRAPVAVATQSGILVSWRALAADDANNVSFNVYRGDKMIAQELNTKTNYLDVAGKPGNIYKVETLVNGKVVQAETIAAWTNMYSTIKINRPQAEPAADGTLGYYRPNSISVGDLDGDGNYDIVIKWMPDNLQDNGYNGYTSPCIIDAYKMDGTQLWRVNLGLNIRSGNHYTQFLVYDFDGDDKAEMICKTAPGSKDGSGNYVSEAGTTASVTGIDNSKTYVNSNGRISGGEELLTVFNGETGKAMHTIYYSPSRSGDTFTQTATSYKESAWGDTNYNRGNRFNAAVAHLDGVDHNASAIMQRGYYTSCYLWAVDWNGTELKTRWVHRSYGPKLWTLVDANNKMLAYDYKTPSAYGQGVHSITTGDVNGDGLDEIVIGSATIAADGKLLCSTGLGHGDAIHVADLCPDRPGLEIMMPYEESPYGYGVHDATTGESIVYATSSGDNGRGLAADFIPSNRGYEFWSLADGYIRSCTDGTILLDKRPDCNFRIYWTGDPYDQTFEGRDYGVSPRIQNYNTTTKKITTVQEFAPFGGPTACAVTKYTPCIQADLIGDWREELIMFKNESNYTSDYCTLMLYSTPEPTKYKVPCLMEDHLYRMGITWQNSAYNQPPHLSYYLPDYLGINGATYTTQSTSNAPTSGNAGTSFKPSTIITDNNGGYDAITTPKAEQEPNTMYDIYGRKVEKPSKGIYISNNKKYVF